MSCFLDVGKLNKFKLELIKIKALQLDFALLSNYLFIFEFNNFLIRLVYFIIFILNRYFTHENASYAVESISLTK